MAKGSQQYTALHMRHHELGNSIENLYVLIKNAVYTVYLVFYGFSPVLPCVIETIQKYVLEMDRVCFFQKFAPALGKDHLPTRVL